MKKALSEAELEQFRTLHRNGQTYRTIARRLGLKLKEIHSLRRQLGLPLLQPPPPLPNQPMFHEGPKAINGVHERWWSDQQKQVLARLWGAGMPLEEIARNLGRSKSSVDLARRRLHLPSRPRGNSRNGKGRSWTASELERFRELWQAHVPIKLIAVELHRPPSSVKAKRLELRLPIRSKGGMTKSVRINLDPATHDALYRRANGLTRTIGAHLRTLIKQDLTHGARRAHDHE